MVAMGVAAGRSGSGSGGSAGSSSSAWPWRDATSLGIGSGATRDDGWVVAKAPERVTRDVAGRLVAVDARAINIARSSDAELVSGITLRLPDPGAKPRGPAQAKAADPLRFTLTLNHRWRLSSELLTRPGVPVIDQLRDTGQSRHLLSLQAVAGKRAFGANVNATWSSPARLRNRAVSGPQAEYRYTPPLLVDLGLFVDPEDLSPSLKRSKLLDDMRISLDVDNLFDTYRRARLGDGSVPAGYTMLVDALERDADMARSFFRQLRRLTSSGAKLPDAIYSRVQALAVQHLGRRIPFVAGYGSTETCAATTVVHWPGERAGLVGLPQPGVTIKLVPLEDERYEVRVKGPSVMPGYLDQPELTSSVFDDEGYYCMGDAVTFVDRAQPDEGLAFAGRVAEEFKLQSGIFVRVGSLRVEAINAAAPLLNDVVVAGADREYVALLAWPNPVALRERFGIADAQSAIGHEALRGALREALRAHNARHTGSSMKVARVLLLAQPPSMDAGEITDKGYVNQRAVLARRADAVERLYDATPADDVIVIAG